MGSRIYSADGNGDACNVADFKKSAFHITFKYNFFPYGCLLLDFLKSSSFPSVKIFIMHKYWVILNAFIEVIIWFFSSFSLLMQMLNCNEVVFQIIYSTYKVTLVI